MSYEEAAPKLPPFGIRELFESETGILHLSKPQYESTIKSYPDAILSYVDDDDGEIITVGSGLELQQRLDEPVRLHRRSKHASQGTLSRKGSMDDNMIHLFDIQRTEDNLAIWREHEAYSSKTLRSNPSSPAVSDVHDEVEFSPWQSDTIRPVSPPSEQQPGLPLPKPVLEAETGPEQQKSEEPQDTPSVGPTSRPVLSNDFMQDLDNVLSAACKGLEAFGLADILDGTAQALQSMAQKTRDADTTPVEGLLGGIKDVVTELGKFGLDILENLDKDLAPSADLQPPATTQTTEDVTSRLSRNATAKKEKEEEKLARKEARVALKEQRREEKRIRRVDRLAHREERRANKKEKGLQNKENEQDEDFYHDVPTARPEQPMPTSPVAIRKRVSFADLQEEIRQRYHAAASSVGASLETPKVSGPVKEEQNVTLPATVIAPGSSASIRQYRNFPNRPGPPLPTPTQNSKPPIGPPSIMDLETSNPDFTARYPPLMSLRRAKTVSELHKKAAPATADNSATTTKSALTRYPSIGQLEAQRRVVEDPTSTQVNAMQADMLRRRERQKAESAAHTHRNPTVEYDKDEPLSSGLLFGNSEKQDLASSVAKPLPGSWPEPRQDEPTRTESSGAFFNRMAGYGNPPPPRAVSPALSCRTTSPPEDPYFPLTGLRRAQTVSHSNPAARLSQPFDPLSNAPRPDAVRQQHPAGPLPQRSFTVHHPHRPAPGPPSSTSNGSTTLWSNFPRSAQIPMIPPQPAPTVISAQPHHPRPVWPNHDNTYASVVAPNRLPRPMRSEPNFHYPAPAPTRGRRNGFFPPPQSSNKNVEECVRTLRAMGYGMDDPNEAGRLSVYAGAALGEVHDAIDMIEEDRKAAEALSNHKVNIRVL